MANIQTIFIFTPAANETIGCPSGNVYTSDTHSLIYNANPGDVGFLVSIGCIELNQRNNVSTAAPTAANDYTQLYGVGSLWYDSSSGVLYVAASVGTTPGTANWLPVNSTTPTNTGITITGSATVGPPNITIFVNNTSAANMVISLQSTYASNASVTVVDIAGNFNTYSCTVTPTAGTIRGGASFVMPPVTGSRETFSFDGTNWW